MPTVGERRSNITANRNWKSDPFSKFANSFRDVANSILNENGVDIFSDPKRAMLMGAASDTMQNFFIEEALDPAEFEDPEDFEDAVEDLKEQFLNDKAAILNETALGSLNPVIGMTFPMHKNILMNNIFDKGAIPKVVAREPKFTISMETRNLVTPDGVEIDMYKEQWKMMDAIDSAAPYVEVPITLPQAGTTDILTAMGAASDDNLDVDTSVSAVQVSLYLKTGDINPETGVAAIADGAVDCWIPVSLPFTPYYGEYDRVIARGVNIESRNATKPEEIIVIQDVVTGYIQKNKVFINCTHGKIKAVKLRARIDTSSAMVSTPSVSWKVRTEIVEIPSANPINVPVSPEEIKDVSALYNVNQLSKILSLLKIVMGNYKDDKIKRHLDESFLTMPETNKLAATFDFAPPARYALDHVEWRHKTFMDALDTHVTKLLQVLNDPNMTITVFGRSDLIRKITPTEYTYQTPSSIGPVELDFVKTVTTSDKRVYQFVATDKLRGNNNLIIILCPRNTERIIYRIYDYQMYISNEIRNMKNYALPAIHAFERWKFVEYQPIQGRVQVLNPTGLTDQVENKDPIGKFSPNDFDSDKPYTP